MHGVVHAAAMRLLPLLFIACACGAPSVPPVPPTLPTLAGRPVYDVPMGEAPPVVRAAWNVTSQLLDDPAPDDPGERVSWMRDRASALADLEDALDPLADGEPRDRVFAAVVLGSLLDDLFEQTRDLPPQVSDPEVRASFAEIVSVFGLAARGQFMRCHASMEDAPEPLRAWAEHCNARAAELLVLNQPSEPPASPLAVCEGEDPTFPDPEAPARDEAAPAEIALVYRGDRFTGRARDRVLGAVRTRLDTLRDEPVLELDEVSTAERLVSERRWTADGPVCGQPPPLAAVLSERHRNLVLAFVETECNDANECTINVWGRAPDSTQVVLHVLAPVVGNRASLQGWLRAAAQLDHVDGSAGDVRGFGTPPGVTYRVLDTGDDDPWLRLGPTLRWEQQARIIDCAPEGTVGLYDVTLALTPAGTVERSTARASVPPTGADGDAIARCIEEHVREIPFPCSRSGAPTEIALRVCLGR